MPSDDSRALDRAAEAIAGADALLVGAGAGMGVDSGLPDFRGREGFWRAYPAAERLGLSFAELANPRWFRDDPAFAWGFYGHRRNLYRANDTACGVSRCSAAGWGGCRGAASSSPRTSTAISRRPGSPADRMVECHGSIERSQCLGGCGAGVVEADPGALAIDMERLRAAGPLPSCPGCGGPSRPNILMFGDWDWDPTVTDEQERRFERWLGSLEGRRWRSSSAGPARRSRRSGASASGPPGNSAGPSSGSTPGTPSAARARSGWRWGPARRWRRSTGGSLRRGVRGDLLGGAGVGSGLVRSVGEVWRCVRDRSGFAGGRSWGSWRGWW